MRRDAGIAATFGSETRLRLLTALAAASGPLTAYRVAKDAEVRTSKAYPELYRLRAVGVTWKGRHGWALADPDIAELLRRRTVLRWKVREGEEPPAGLAAWWLRAVDLTVAGYDTDRRPMLIVQKDHTSLIDAEGIPTLELHRVVRPPTIEEVVIVLMKTEVGAAREILAKRHNRIDWETLARRIMEEELGWEALYIGLLPRLPSWACQLLAPLPRARLRELDRRVRVRESSL